MKPPYFESGNRLPTGVGSRGGRWHEPEYRRAYHRAWRLAHPEYRERERLRRARQRVRVGRGPDPAIWELAEAPSYPRPLPSPAVACLCPDCVCRNETVALCGLCAEGLHQ